MNIRSYIKTIEKSHQHKNNVFQYEFVEINPQLYPFMIKL